MRRGARPVEGRHPGARSSRSSRDERGVGLVEVIVATIVAVVAIVALAYTFGTGRGLVNRYEAARVALATAQGRMERLAAGAPSSPDLLMPSFPSTAYGPFPVQVDGRTVAYESWTVEAYDDRADGSYTGTELDLKRVTVSVTWGRRGPGETITLTRLFPLY
jgi:type II secretory pathway pseudopilin PulG